MKKTKKKYLLGGIALICAIGILYLAASLFFIEHYYIGTKIGSIDCGGKNQKAVEALVEELAGNYRLQIQGREGTEATLSAGEIGVEFLLDDTLERVRREQNAFLWISFLWNQREHEMPVRVRYNKALLDDRLEKMLMFQRKTMKKPVNAYVGEYDPKSNSYSIVPEELGTYLDQEKAEAAIVHAIEQMETTLDLEKADCYLQPEIKQTEEGLVQLCNRLNRYVSSRIVYDWHGIEEVIDGALISQWMEIDREKERAALNPQLVRDHVDQLSRKHDGFGKIRQFTTSYGKEIYLEPGDYGWRVNRSKEAEKLMQLIRFGWQGEREPEYLYTAAVRGKDDIGDSYVEINLAGQHLYLYEKGELITETDFVSGNVSRGFDTPNGVYGLTYKTQDAILKGQGYATPVKYWMPFNGNVGMHDAKWRNSFGGDIYLKNGSHGCINLPPEQAALIYEHVSKGFPVICYTDEDGKQTEKEQTEKEQAEKEQAEDKETPVKEEEPSEESEDAEEAE